MRRLLFVIVLLAPAPLFAQSAPFPVQLPQGVGTLRVPGAGGDIVAVNTLCMSQTTKDSYFAEIGANNPGAYTNGTDCAGGTLRFDWNASRFNLNYGQGIAATPTDSLLIANNTASTGAVTVQMSPRMRLRGSAWDANDTVSRTFDWTFDQLPVTGNTVSSAFRLRSSLDGAAYADVFTASDAGAFFFKRGTGGDNELSINIDTNGNIIYYGSVQATKLNFFTNNLDRWSIGASSGHLLAEGAVGFGMTVPTMFNTAPTISSGFGTGPSIAASNGSSAFTINVGTGGSASSGVIGLPTATTGWAVQCHDVTTQSSTVFVTKQTATATTTATIGNFDAAGAAAAWAASDILVCQAQAY